MDVRLPDGTIIKNVPDGITKAELVGKLKSGGMAVPAEWLGEATKPEPTDREKLLASTPMRLAKGGKDPIDGAAQLVQRMLPDSVVNAVNAAADKIGGEGTFLGDVLGIKGMTKEQMTADIRNSNAEYEAARDATGQTGFDGARLLGNVASPVNVALGRVLPGVPVGAKTGKLVAQGTKAGAVGAATQPVMSDNYAGEKALQIGAGAVAGGALTPVLTRAGESVARFVRDRLSNGAVSKTPEAIALEIKASLQRDDIDVSQIPRHVMDKLTQEVNQALSKGQELNAPALLRKMDFDRVGVKPMLGQLTRDPTQYTREMNLRGVQGVGEPIANRLSEQQAVIASKFRQGTAGAKDRYEAGDALLETLKAKNAEMEGGVRAAYQAFKDSTGKDLPVQISAMRKGYGETLKEFGETIPSAVRRRFEEIISGPKPAHSHGAKAPAQNPLQILDANGGVLSDLSAKPVPRTLSIEDAERLIKTINRHYNPADRAQARALDELRGHVQSAIYSAGDEASEAGALAKVARETAKKRFDAIDSAPALKAAIDDAAPDDFVKKYIINGKVREINKLAELVGPEGQKTMQQQLLKHLQNKAFGANAAGDGAGQQASLNSELQSIGRNKLTALLGAEQADDLFALGRVMAYIQQQPAGSAVNNSNTGAMVASLLGKVGGKIKGAPYINDFVVRPIQSFQDRAAATNALTAKLPAQATELEPNTVNMLSRLLQPVPVASGAALGYLVR
jgi:hypothetical protein